MKVDADAKGPALRVWASLRVGFCLSLVIALLVGAWASKTQVDSVVDPDDGHASVHRDLGPLGRLELVAEAEEQDERDDLEERTAEPASLVELDAPDLVVGRCPVGDATPWSGRPRLGGAFALGRGPPSLPPSLT